LSPKSKKEKRKEETEKKENGSIFSKLDELDSKSKEKGREIEEKLRIGLIKSKEVEKEKEPEKEKTKVIEIKKEIEKLRSFKQNCFDNEEYDDAMDFSKKIISIAFANKLKSTIDEEKKFIDLVQNKLNQKSTDVD
jgi:hypothetical protein